MSCITNSSQYTVYCTNTLIFQPFIGVLGARPTLLALSIYLQVPKEVKRCACRELIQVGKNANKTCSHDSELMDDFHVIYSTNNSIHRKPAIEKRI